MMKFDARNATYDAIIVGSGPNGLAAGITLAQKGRSVLLLEAADTIGGGTRTKELTLPGFLHDVCSAIHPLGIASPFFRTLPLSEYGLEWIHPSAPLAHPLDDGTAVVLERSLDATAARLGADGPAYAALMRPLVTRAQGLCDDLLGPLRLPRHPISFAKFGLHGMHSARGLAEKLFNDAPARALFAGLAAHSILPLERSFTATLGLVLAITGHSVGWPVAKGGSARISDAMAAYFLSLGGEIAVNSRVDSLDQLPKSKAVLLDVTPRQLLAIVGDRLPNGYRRRLARYRYGPGAFKVDWALAGPVPWTARDCARAATVHVGGTLDEIAASERAPWAGEHAERPFVLFAQQSLFDPSRAPPGRQTGWAYCHVPHGSTFDMTTRIEAQIERFAPGFRDLILARHVTSPAAFETYNPNYIGGDIIGGVQDIGQLFTRPVSSFNPYAIPAKGIYLCSSSTPPGGGVHGMCGYFAAKAALRASLR